MSNKVAAIEQRRRIRGSVRVIHYNARGRGGNIAKLKI